MKDKKYNVAVAVIWFTCYADCQKTYGSEYFTNSVWCFYHMLNDLDNDKMAIKTKVSNYIKNTWKPNVNHIAHKRLTTDNISPNDENNIALYTDEVTNERIVELFEFIIQTIQDSGVGWPTQDEIKSYMISQE